MVDRMFEHRVFSRIYAAVLFAAACTVALFQWEVNGAILFAYAASAALILSSRLTDAMLPAMLLSVFVTRCYKSADVFLGKLPWMIPVALAILLHFVIYRNKYRENLDIGPSLWGLLAVAFAVTLGGLGTISASEYFAGGSLFYIFGLGFGMVLFYLIVKANFTQGSSKEVAKILYLAGLLACVCVLRLYIADLLFDMRAQDRHYFQSGNNLSTFLMLAMPIPMLYASKRYVHLLSVPFMYGCILLTGSRGGLLMGTAEFFIILLVFACRKQTKTGLRLLCGGMAAVALGVILLFPAQWMTFLKIPFDADNATAQTYVTALKNHLIIDGEARVRLLGRMKTDLRSNPLFGVGIGYKGNSDLYRPAKGAMNWYHMWLAQVVGGLGIVGILAYGYQLMHRIVIFFRNRSLANLVFFLSYIGLFLMSQVNPGEFCPMPYAALAMTYFVIMEMEEPPQIVTVEKKPLWKQLLNL